MKEHFAIFNSKALRAMAPVAIFMVTAWLGLMIILYVISFIVDLRLSYNPLVDQLLKLGAFGTLVIIWLYLWFWTTNKYRDAAIKEGKGRC